jgi:hypothetical protein
MTMLDDDTRPDTERRGALGRLAQHDDRAPTERAGVRRAVDAAVFSAIVGLALSRLAEPFEGDQGVAILMAQVIASGGAPYLDLWSQSYPGIFYFFVAGGTLFGFHEFGIHLLELLWMVSLAVTVRLAAAHLASSPIVASLAPLLTVFAYYAWTTSYHLTQVEGLVALPLLLSLVTAVTAVRQAGARRAWWLVASGASAGATIVFAPIYGVIPVLFWLLAGLERWRGREHPVAVGRSLAPPLLAGMLLLPSLTVLHLASTSGLALAWWTFAVYPFEALAECPWYPDRLLVMVLWFARSFRVPLVLAAVGAVSRLRAGPDLLTAGLLVWAVAALPLIGAQVLSWWSYQSLLLFVPVGLLATPGLEVLWRSARNASARWPQRAAAAALLVAIGVLCARQLEPVRAATVATIASMPASWDRASVDAAVAARYAGHAGDLNVTAIVRAPESHPGPIYVIERPNLYHVAGRRPAIPLLAAWFRPTQELWRRLVAELEAAAPPYILVDDHELAFIAYQNPGLSTEVSRLRSRLHDRYEALGPPAGRTWYVRRDLHGTIASPDAP